MFGFAIGTILGMLATIGSYKLGQAGAILSLKWHERKQK